MGRSMRSWPIVGRAFRRASISPALASALSFTLVLTLIGSVSFVAAIPGLAAESPLVRELTGGTASVSVLGGPLSATGSRHAGAAGGLGADGDGIGTGANADDASGADASAADLLRAGGQGGIPAPGGALQTSSVIKVDPTFGGGGAYGSTGAAPGGASSRQNASTNKPSSENKETSSSGSSNSSNSSGGKPSSGNQGSQGSGGNGQSGGSGGSTGQNPAPDPEPAPVLPPEEGGPVPEDMELRIRDALRSEFDILDSYAKQVYECVDDFNRLSLTDPKSPRQAAARKADDLLYRCQVSGAYVSEATRIACGMQQEYGGIWATSRYTDNYTSIQHCYGHLENMLYQLSNAWSGNCYFDVPSEHVDYWGDRVSVDKKTGKMTCMEDYEAARKGARP